MDIITIFGIFLASLFVLSLITYKVIQLLSSGRAAPQIRRKSYSAPVRYYKDDILMESNEIRYSKEIEPAKSGEDLMDLIQSYEEGKEEEKIVEKPLEKIEIKEKNPPEIDAKSRENLQLDPSRRLDEPGPVEDFLEDIFTTEKIENESYNKNKPLKRTTGIKEKKTLEPSPVEDFLEDVFGDIETKETGDVSQGDLEEFLAPEAEEEEVEEGVPLKLKKEIRPKKEKLHESVEELTNTNRDLSPGEYPECFGTDVEFKKCKKDCGVAKDCSNAIQLLDSM